MFGQAYYVRSRIFNNRYRIVGIMGGFYLLRGFDDSGNFNNKKRAVPTFCARLFYRGEP